MQLECGPCAVRPWQRSDRDSLVALADNRNIWRNLTHAFPHPYRVADADAWFALLEAQPALPEWAIALDERAVGGIGLRLGSGVHSPCAQLGYWLGEPYWGRGLVSAAVREVARVAFARYGVARLEAEVYAWNPRSMRVLEKNGFERESLRRRSIFKDGELIDSAVYVRFG